MKRLAGIALALGLSFALLPKARAEAPEASASEYATTEAGRRVRVRFDPASRLALGVSGAAHEGGVSTEIAGGFGYRSILESGKGHDTITWQLDHRAFEGWVAPALSLGRSLPALDAALYGISARRHDESPVLVIPASPPIGLPFPFDVGLEAEVGRVSIPYAPAPGVTHIGVVRAAFLLDPWRSNRPGNSFSFGIGARYDVDAAGLGLSAGTTPVHVVHRIAPLTAGSIRLRLQDRDGLSTFDGGGELAPEWSSDVGGFHVAARAGARLERIVAALDDQPIAATLEGGYRFLPGAGDVPASHEVRVSLGLSFHVALR